MSQALMIEWGMPIENRELKALEVYTATMRWWNEQQERGRFVRFQPYGTLTGNLDGRSGFVLIEGSQKQIDELRHADDFRQVLNRISAIAHNIRTTVLETGDDMTKRMQRYGNTVKDTLG